MTSRWREIDSEGERDLKGMRQAVKRLQGIRPIQAQTGRLRLTFDEVHSAVSEGRR